MTLACDSVLVLCKQRGAYVAICLPGEVRRPVPDYFFRYRQQHPHGDKRVSAIGL